MVNLPFPLLLNQIYYARVIPMVTRLQRHEEYYVGRFEGLHQRAWRGTFQRFQHTLNEDAAFLHGEMLVYQ